MPTFEFQATHPDGTVESGNIIGPNLETALADLGKRGLAVDKISVARLMNDPLSAAQPVAPKTVRDHGPVQPPQVQPPQVQPPQVQAPQIQQPNIQQPYAEQSYGQQAYSQAPASGPLEGAAAYQGMPDTHFNSQGVNAQGQRVLPDLGQRSYVQTHVIGPVVNRIPLANLGFMFRQLGTMLNAGVPIVQSLETLAGQAKHPQQQQMTREMAHLAKEGLPISTAMQRYPESITPVMISLIRAGEEGGFLDQALYQVSDYIDREIELRNLYKRNTFYPKLVLFGSFVVIIATNFIIASMGKQGGLESPLSIGTWLFIAAAVIGYNLFLRVGLANPGIKFWWDKYTLKVPLLGKTLHELAMARFGRAFGALYKAGVPLNKAMPLSADACGNEYIRATLYPSFRRMDEGQGIFETLRTAGVFSPIVLDMIGTGEKTGNMEQMVTKVSEYYEQEATTRQNMIAAAYGVAAVVFIAIYIGFMLVKFYTGPMYGGAIQQELSNSDSQ